MNPATIDVPMLDIRAALGNIDEESREVDLVFSTGAEGMRYDYNTGTRYIERLSMKPEHIRLDRLNNGAPLLDSHSRYSLASQIGAVKPGTAKVTKGEGIARVRFSKRDQVTPIWGDVKDRIVTKASVGYLVHAYQETPGKNGGLPTRTAIDWEPFEISMVPIAFDDRAQTRSGAEKGQIPLPALFPCVIVRTATPLDAEDLLRRFRLLSLAG